MAVLFFTTAAFFGRSGVISASLCVSVQAPLTAQTVGGCVGGRYGHRCHNYSDFKTNQLPSNSRLTGTFCPRPKQADLSVPASVSKVNFWRLWISSSIAPRDVSP